MNTFKAGPNVDPTIKRCSVCESPMVSRGAFADMPADLRAGKVPHGAKGVCRGCDSSARWRARSAARAAATSTPVVRRRKLTEADYRREEWLFLKSMGVSAHDAAQRLGVSVETLTSYERAA